MKNRPDPRLPRISALAKLVHQSNLARLAQEKAALDAAQTALRALEPSPIDLSEPKLIEAQLRHQKWAAACRHKLEAEQERRKAAVAMLRHAAAHSLARSEVIDALLVKSRPDQPS